MRRVSRFLRAHRLVIALFLSLPLIATGSFAQADSPRPAANQALTIDRIFGGPSLNGRLTQGIEWSPDAKRISYLERNPPGKDTGVELWTIDATTGSRKVLVNSATLQSVMLPQATSAIQATGLGRIQPEGYLWSPTGDSLLFIGSNDLILLDLKKMTQKRLVTGDHELEDPKFSPDGKWVSFVRDANLWVANIATGEIKALTTGGSEEVLKGKLDWVYPEELDLTSAYWWSPDSSKIAYYEMDERPVTRYPIMDMSSAVGALEYTRFPQAGETNPIVRVGVVPVGGGETKWMDSGGDTDVYLARVVWLHDSERVAIERLNRGQNRLDLLFCDVSTGASKQILTEKDKYWVNISDDLYFFLDDKRFLWSSERTGFRHYYLYDLAGKQLDQLTSGDWGITGTSGVGPGEVNHSAVDEAHGAIYFRSNKSDARDTQLYRLSLADKSLTQITQQAGTHRVLIAPDDSAYVDTYSNVMTPSRQDLYRADGTRVVVINENKVSDLDEYHLSPIELGELPVAHGTKLETMMIKPPSFDPSHKYPVLIDVYGGPQEQTVRNAWGGLDALWLQMMAQKGYIIYRLDNRGSYNRGHAFETPIYHQLGKVELEDQLAGVKYLKSLPYVDGTRIGIWGWSYGGTMTLEAMANAPDVFKAGVAVAPVSDWGLYDTIYTERYMGRPQDDPDAYKNSSPVNQIANVKGKLMLAHGTGDDNVHFANTSKVLNAFIDNGSYPTDVMIFPGRGHSIGDYPAHVELFERITEFLLNNL